MRENCESCALQTRTWALLPQDCDISDGRAGARASINMCGDNNLAVAL